MTILKMSPPIHVSLTIRVFPRLIAQLLFFLSISPLFGQYPLGAGGVYQNRPVRESELIAAGRPLPDYDVRRESQAQISKSQTQSARDLQRQTGAGTTVKLSAVSGGVSQVFRLGGYLTSKDTASPSAIVTQYLAQNRALFGLSPAAIASFKNVAEDRDASTGVTHLYLQQQIDGLEVF